MNQKNNKRLLETFLRLIKINETYDEENEILRYVEAKLDKAKVQHVRDKFKNVVVYLEGNGNPILLNTHLDVPEHLRDLSYRIDGSIVHSSGNSILGADPKSGLAVLLELICLIRERKLKTRPLEIVFTRGEEAGLLGAINLDYSLLRSKIGLVLDEDGPCTNVVIRAPGYYRIDCKFIGKTVHTRDWKQGINSIAAAARAINTLKQGEIARGVTFNIGLINGGTARNSVPGITEIKSELRSFDNQRLADQSQYVKQQFIKIGGKSKGQVEIDDKLEFKSYYLKRDHGLFIQLEKTYQEMGLKPNYYETFGGSDANIFNSHGIVAVPIGSGYYNPHQYTEYIKLDEMEQLALFLVKFIS